jgi:class 3 adenylate cyclase
MTDPESQIAVPPTLTVETALLDQISETLYRILKGKDLSTVPMPASLPDNEVRQVLRLLNEFVEEYRSLAAFMYSIARGELDFEPPRSRMELVSSFKTLQASLRHLTYKTQAIAKGDFAQRVDFIGDFSVAFNSMTVQLKEAFEKIEKQNLELQNANRTIQEERDKSERLLANTLPPHVIAELKSQGTSEPRTFENVAVYFSDIVGFTARSAGMPPAHLITELNELFTGFDAIFEANGCERVKTIGDAYLAVCGMDQNRDNPSACIVRAALQILEFLKRRNRASEVRWEVRIGIHTGRVVGGIVGTRKFLYDVFGDTINTASRMESNSLPMRVNVSETTWEQIRDQYRGTDRGCLEVKGKGAMRMFFVEEIGPQAVPTAEPPHGQIMPRDDS